MVQPTQKKNESVDFWEFDERRGEIYWITLMTGV